MTKERAHRGEVTEKSKDWKGKMREKEWNVEREREEWERSRSREREDEEKMASEKNTYRAKLRVMSLQIWNRMRTSEVSEFVKECVWERERKRMRFCCVACAYNTKIREWKMRLEEKMKNKRQSSVWKTKWAHTTQTLSISSRFSHNSFSFYPQLSLLFTIMTLFNFCPI